jgi:hypothetical protein
MRQVPARDFLIAGSGSGARHCSRRSASCPHPLPPRSAGLPPRVQAEGIRDHLAIREGS